MTRSRRLELCGVLKWVYTRVGRRDTGTLWTRPVVALWEASPAHLPHRGDGIDQGHWRMPNRRRAGSLRQEGVKRKSGRDRFRASQRGLHPQPKDTLLLLGWNPGLVPHPHLGSTNADHAPIAKISNPTSQIPIFKSQIPHPNFQISNLESQVYPSRPLGWFRLCAPKAHRHRSLGQRPRYGSQ